MTLPERGCHDLSPGIDGTSLAMSPCRCRGDISAQALCWSDHLASYLVTRLIQKAKDTKSKMTQAFLVGWFGLADFVNEYVTENMETKKGLSGWTR